MRGDRPRRQEKGRGIEGESGIAERDIGEDGGEEEEGEGRLLTPSAG